MRIRFNDSPAWLAVAMVVIGIVTWVVHLVVHRRRANSAARQRPVRVADDGEWEPSPFALTSYERALHGVEYRGSQLRFGPSGRQVVAAVVTPVPVVAGVASILAAEIAWWVQSVGFVAGVVVAGACLAGLRVGVWATPSELTLRNRCGRIRRFPWSAIEAIRVDVVPANIQLMGTTSSADVGVYEMAGRPPRPLPGFRAVSWGSDDEPDPVPSAADQKVAILRRFRQCAAGPWPAG